MESIFSFFWHARLVGVIDNSSTLKFIFKSLLTPSLSLSAGRPLLHIGMNLFHRHKLSDTFSLDPLKLFEFLTQVEHNYHPENSYHNSYHAADVTQALHCLIVDPVVSEYVL